MNKDPLEDRAALLLSKVAADAAAEVQGAVVGYAAVMGRSGIVMRLRAQARDLATSAIGHDQVSSLAFEAAADDMAWGRAPLESWRPFALGAPGASILERGALRASLPPAGAEVASRGERAARPSRSVSCQGTMPLTLSADTPARSKPTPRSNRRSGTIRASPPRRTSA